jgi:hypothetical protein
LLPASSYTSCAGRHATGQVHGILHTNYRSDAARPSADALIAVAAMQGIVLRVEQERILRG